MEKEGAQIPQNNPRPTQCHPALPPLGSDNYLSDHVPRLFRVNTAAFGWLTFLSANCFEGGQKGRDLPFGQEQQDPQKELQRKQAIAKGINNAIEQHQPDIIALQEVTAETHNWSTQKKQLLEHKDTIVHFINKTKPKESKYCYTDCNTKQNSKTGEVIKQSVGQGDSVTMYMPKNYGRYNSTKLLGLQPVKLSNQEAPEPLFETKQVRLFNSLDSKSQVSLFRKDGKYLCVWNVHYPFHIYPDEQEKKVQEDLGFCKQWCDKNEIDFFKVEHVFVGDFNCNFAPVHEKPINIVTNVAVPPTEQENIEKQSWFSPDGCLHIFYDNTPEKKQVIKPIHGEHLNLETGNILTEDERKPIDQPLHSEEPVSVQQQELNTPKPIAMFKPDEDIMQYESACKQKLGIDNLLVRRCCDANNQQKGYAVCLKIDAEHNQNCTPTKELLAKKGFSQRPPLVMTGQNGKEEARLEYYTGTEEQLKNLLTDEKELKKKSPLLQEKPQNLLSRKKSNFSGVAIGISVCLGVLAGATALATLSVFTAGVAPLVAAVIAVCVIIGGGMIGGGTTALTMKILDKLFPDEIQQTPNTNHDTILPVHDLPKNKNNPDNAKPNNAKPEKKHGHSFSFNYNFNPNPDKDNDSQHNISPENSNNRLTK